MPIIRTPYFLYFSYSRNYATHYSICKSTSLTNAKMPTLPSFLNPTRQVRLLQSTLKPSKVSQTGNIHIPALLCQTS